MCFPRNVHLVDTDFDQTVFAFIFIVSSNSLQTHEMMSLERLLKLSFMKGYQFL